MLEIGAFQAKNTFGTLLDRVAAGEDVVITRRGKPAARLVPFDGTAAESHRQATAAVARIRERAKRSHFAPISRSEWSEFRNEGRR